MTKTKDWPITDEIKEQIVDRLMTIYGIDAKHSPDVVLSNVRELLDDSSKDDVEIYITLPHIEFCARLSLSIVAQRKQCGRCHGIPTRTVCTRCNDSGFEKETRDE